MSVGVLAPCWWHRRIEAGDLASHTYNAWLAQLIDRGQAPGLWLARQWNNVLFDIALTDLGRLIGLGPAEKIVVSAAVLVFFWGAFALIAALTRRSPWHLVPCVAMFTYGWTFQMGFLNYYISLGLAFLGIAMVVERGQRWNLVAALVLLPVAWMAHPIGAVVLAGTGTYVYIAQKSSRQHQRYLLLGTGLLLMSAFLYITGHYGVVRTPDTHSYLQILGADQLALYGSRYTLVANLLIFFMLGCVVTDVIGTVKAPGGWADYSLIVQLCAIVVTLIFLLPDGIVLPRYSASVTMLPQRLTSVTAILACGLVAVGKPRKWQWAGFLAIAGVFFVFLYADGSKLNKMEEQAERYERVLPPGQRIIATIWPFTGSRVLIHHIVDRACIGYCFSYGNYEPSSGQFRLRAKEGNRFVVADNALSEAMKAGDYLVTPHDLPMFEIYQCNLNMTELCMRALSPGETNGRVGVHPIR